MFLLERPEILSPAKGSPGPVATLLARTVSEYPSQGQLSSPDRLSGQVGEQGLIFDGNLPARSRIFIGGTAVKSLVLVIYVF